jgi:hypothetical protein
VLIQQWERNPPAEKIPKEGERGSCIGDHRALEDLYPWWSVRLSSPSRRRRLLLGGALSLGLVYAILVQIDPMGYGSRDAKRGAQYSALGSKGKKMVSSKAKQADSGTYAGYIYIYIYIYMIFLTHSLYI